MEQENESRIQRFMKKNRTCCQSDCLLIDLFAKKPQLRLPSGRTKYNTCRGSLCSLLYVIIVMIFGFTSFGEVMEVQEYIPSDQVQIATTRSIASSITKEDYFAPKQKLSESELPIDQLQIAFGIVDLAYPDEALPAEVGTLKAFYRSWDMTSEDREPKYTEIPSFPCTTQDLGLYLDGEDEESSITNARFFQPWDESSRYALPLYQQRLQCIDKEAAQEISANQDHMKGTQLVLLLEKCQEGSDVTCLAETARQLASTQIMVYSNQRTFLQGPRLEVPYKDQARMYWLPIDPTKQENSVFTVNQGVVATQDMILEPIIVHRHQTATFWLSGGYQQTNSFKDSSVKQNVVAAVTFERNLNLKVTSWLASKSIFIWFGTLCGFAVGAYLVCFCLEYYLTISRFHDYLASELYTVHPDLLQKKKRSDNSAEDFGYDFDQNDEQYHVARGKVSHSFHNAILGDQGKVLNRSGLGLFCCCASSRYSNVFSQARTFANEELNITSIIKAQRQSHIACKLLAQTLANKQVIDTAVKRPITDPNDPAVRAMREKKLEEEKKEGRLDDLTAAFGDLENPMNGTGSQQALLKAMHEASNNITVKPESKDNDTKEKESDREEKKRKKSHHRDRRDSDRDRRHKRRRSGSDSDEARRRKRSSRRRQGDEKRDDDRHKRDEDRHKSSRNRDRDRDRGEDRDRRDKDRGESRNPDRDEKRGSSKRKKPETPKR